MKVKEYMNIWEFFNSPIILTTITLIWGSLIASWITALWQNRSHRYEVKLQYMQSITKTYQEYIRLIRDTSSNVSGENYDTLHADIVSQMKFISFLYKNKLIGEGWDIVIAQLANIRGLRIEGKNTNFIDNKLKDVYPEVDKIIKLMVRELEKL